MADLLVQAWLCDTYSKAEFGSWNPPNFRTCISRDEATEKVASRSFYRVSGQAPLTNDRGAVDPGGRAAIPFLW